MAEDRSRRKVVHDGDHGIDDALATMFLAGRDDVELLAVGSVHGNAPADIAAANALQVLDVCGRRDIPVAVGAARPLAQQAYFSALVHGADGLGGRARSVPGRAPRPGSAAQQLVRTVREHPGECTVLATGPLTNLALALLIEPRLPELVQRVVVMGGTLGEPGNISPVAETNILRDPEAAATVLAAGLPLTLVGLDVTMRAWLSRADLDRISRAAGPKGAFAWSVLQHYVAYYQGHHHRVGCPLHDPSAAVLTVDPDAARYDQLSVTVELHGQWTRGMLVTDRRGYAPPAEGTPAMPRNPPITVARSVDRDRLVGQFLDGLLREPGGPAA